MQALPFYAQPGPTGAPRFMLNTEACYLQGLELSWAEVRPVPRVPGSEGV